MVAAGVNEMSDHFEVQNVLARYTSAITRRDWAAVAATFSPKATWEVVGGPHPAKVEGPRLAEGLQAMCETTAVLIQLITPAAIELRGEHAEAHCNLHEFGEMLDRKTHFEASGTYDDVLEKVDGRWRFVSRRCAILKFRAVSINAS
jgi:ketosteroid isomerase-like protein